MICSKERCVTSHIFFTRRDAVVESIGREKLGASRISACNTSLLILDSLLFGYHSGKCKYFKKEIIKLSSGFKTAIFAKVVNLFASFRNAILLKSLHSSLM